MKLTSISIENGRFMLARYAFGRIDADNHMALSDNVSPQLEWQDVPDGTKSFALLCIDPDVPTVPELVNTEQEMIPVDLPRCDFCHWSMINIPSDTRQLEEKACSAEVTVGGKQNPPGPAGSRQGLNDYTGFFAGGEMAGQYHGYDGPCPPWNDERMHHYHFTVYALDVERLDLPEVFTSADVASAITDHIIDQATLSVRYSLHPDLDELAANRG